MLQVLVLAAGEGRRLGAVAGGKPKCLLRVGGRSLIEHQLDALEQLGVDRVSVVVGYGADQVRSQLGDRCDYIVNRRYGETNSLYSLSLASEYVHGAFVLVNSDVIVHPVVYRDVLSVGGSALAFDSSSGWHAEHMKVTLDGTLLRTIGKDLSADQVDGENVGIIYFDGTAADLLFSATSELIAQGAERQWAPAAVGRIASSTPIEAVDIAGVPWGEIDFPEDLRDAQERVWPAIRDTVGPTCCVRCVRSSHRAPMLSAGR